MSIFHEALNEQMMIGGVSRGQEPGEERRQGRGGGSDEKGEVAGAEDAAEHDARGR